MHQSSFSGHTNGIQIGNDNIQSDRKDSVLLYLTNDATLTHELLKQLQLVG